MLSLKSGPSVRTASRARARRSRAVCGRPPHTKRASAPTTCNKRALRHVRAHPPAARAHLQRNPRRGPPPANPAAVRRMRNEGARGVARRRMH